MAPHRPATPSATSGLPRPRGDGPARTAWHASPSKAPPPARGWPLRPSKGARTGGGSPARAGMAPARLRPWRGRFGLPRPRGDGPLSEVADALAEQAPPPARGWPLLHRLVITCIGGSPARAGMAPDCPMPPREAQRLPRPRGDGPVFVINAQQQSQAPPPARGWPLGKRSVENALRGSPARAGMAPHRSRWAAVRRRLPRPRGRPVA